MAAGLLVLGFVSVPYLIMVLDSSSDANNNGFDTRRFDFKSLVEAPAALKPDDPELVQYVRDNFLFTPKDYVVSNKPITYVARLYL